LPVGGAGPGLLQWEEQEQIAYCHAEQHDAQTAQSHQNFTHHGRSPSTQDLTWPEGKFNAPEEM